MAAGGAQQKSAREPPPKPTRWRRVVALLSQRDWVGIAIELAIVTLGVLLAFQIEQWAQDRRRVSEERQFLERMWRETAEALDETEWAMTMHGRFRREFIDGFTALGDDAALERLSRTPNVGCRAATLPGLGFNLTSFQELSASGRLNIISDPMIRSDLRDVVAAQANAEETRLNAQPLSIENQRALDSYYLLGLDANENRTCRMDWRRLAQDPGARNAVVRSVRLHTLNWLQRAYLRDRLATANNRIACALEKPHCRTRVPQIFRDRPRYDVIPPEARDDALRSAEMYSGS